MAETDISSTATTGGDGPSSGAWEYGKFRYDLDERIGGRYLVHRRVPGGFGHVYLCYDEETDFFVALKTLKLTQEAVRDPTRLADLKREADYWIALGEHPNLVRCHSYTMIDHLPFMVLEWVADDDSLAKLYHEHHHGKPNFLDWYARLGRQGLELRACAEIRNHESAGTSLEGWIKRRQCLPLGLALRIAHDICAGLNYAQSIHPGLIHRDLKPKNVLLTEQSRAKVSDFGIAKVASEILTGGETFGTPEYKSPEQWCGGPLDTRTDIYALGCVLYTMLCGHPPFGHRDSEDLRIQHELATPNFPHQFIPPSLIQVLERCLAKSPSGRFASWAELDDALDACADSRSRHTFVVSNPSTPGTVEASNQLAVGYYHLEKYDAALAEFARALRLDPIHANTYTNRGCVYHMLGEHEAALADYTQAIRLGREAINAKVRNNRGLLYLAAGRLERAVTDFQRALASEPEYANAHANLGIAYTLQGEYAQALAAFARALEIAPTHVPARYNRGCVYEMEGNDSAARADYRAAVEHNPLFAPAQARLGLLSARREGQAVPPPEPVFGRPNPQFVNQGSLEGAIARPWVEHRIAERRWDEKLGTAAPLASPLPARAFVRVRQVDYAGFLHAAILAQQAKGARITQLALLVEPLGGTSEFTGAQPQVACALWLDEEAMRKLAAAGPHTIYDLAGRFVTLRQQHPVDATYPLRLDIVH